MFKRVAVFGLVALVIALALGAVPASAEGPIEGRAGRAEVRFMEGMADHHQMALDMSNDCLKNALAADVKTMCQNIITAQTAEITTMIKWLADWYKIDYKPIAMADMQKAMPDMGGMNMNGMATDPAGMMGMMAGLNRLKGAEYDLAFLESMIDHHSDALTMANRILQYPSAHSAVKALANRIITAQTAEIAKMEAMLKTMGDK